VLRCPCSLSRYPTIVSSFNCFLPLRLFFFCLNVYFATPVYEVLLMAWDVHFGMQCSRYLRLLRGLVYAAWPWSFLWSLIRPVIGTVSFLLFIFSFSRLQVPGVGSVSRMWTGRN
ncbi:hypothetical protein CCUS01_16221, partial [Colletotrichum cuscutae]